MKNERVYKDGNDFYVSPSGMDTAKAYERNYSFDKAIASYKRVVRRHPDYTPAMIGVATCLMKKGDLDAAIEYLKERIEWMEDHPFRVECVGLRIDEQYHNYEDCLETLNIYIDKMQAKKARGYKYKPRPR